MKCAPNISEILSRPNVSLELIQEALGKQSAADVAALTTKDIEDVRELLQSKLSSLKVLSEKKIADRLQSMMQNLENAISRQRNLSTNESIKESTIEEVESEKVVQLINYAYTFSSPAEAELKLFRNHTAALSAYQDFMVKHLIGHLFLSLDRELQITNNDQLQAQINLYVNDLSRILIKKPILRISTQTNKVELLRDEYYELNQRINEILSKSEQVSIFEKKEGDPESGIYLVDGKIKSQAVKNVVAAVTFANFNTILKEYLPILNIESDFNGFDVSNINNPNIYTLTTKSAPIKMMSDQETVEKSSRLAKLLLSSFKTVLVKTSQTANANIEFNVSPKIEQQGYYNVMSILKKHIGTTNFQNQTNRLLKQLMQYQTMVNGDRLISNQEFLTTNDIGQFNLDYIKSQKDLIGLMNNSTTQSVVGTLYLNLAQDMNDPILKHHNANNKFLNSIWSVKKYYSKYKNQPSFDKNNLQDVIYSTFYNITPRNHHDIVYDPVLKMMVPRPLFMSNINKIKFDVLKVHRYLKGWSQELYSLKFNDFTKASFTINVPNGTQKFTFTGSAWVGDSLKNKETLNEIYDIFYNLTNIDLLEQPTLLYNEAFTINNILNVIYAMVNLQRTQMTDSTALSLINSTNQLGKQWGQYAVNTGVNINNILSRMGQAYAIELGSFSKMTTLSKEKKALPTYGSTSMLFDFESRLNYLRNRDDSFYKNNIFVLNPNLFGGVSNKNQIVSNDRIVDYRSQNLTDQIMVDLFFEWFQKRMNFTANDASGEKITVNEDHEGIHIQPIVYADKPNQAIVKINNLNEINYVKLDGNKARISLRLFNNKEDLKQLQEATYHSLQTQHMTYADYVIKNLVKIITLNTDNFDIDQFNVNDAANLIVELQNVIHTGIQGKNIQDSVERAWKQTLPDVPFISNLLTNRGDLNVNFLTFVKLFNDQDLFNNFSLLGEIQFLQNLADMNIDQTNPDNRITNYTDKSNSIVKDMNSIIDPDIRKELMDLNDQLNNLITSDTNLFALISGDMQGLKDKLLAVREKSSAIYLQYFWEKLFFGSNLEMAGNGPIYLHPYKSENPVTIDGVNYSMSTTYSKIAQQLGASQKRNVSYQGTVSPYINNTIRGIALTRKVLVYKDPISNISNPLGEFEKVKIHDGGEHILLLQRILENASMPVQGNPNHHKSFIPGIVVGNNGELLNSLLFKYASYSLNNIKLRSSQNYRNMVKMALSESIPFYKMDMFTKDYDGNAIDYGKYGIVYESNAYGNVLLKRIEYLDGLYYATVQDIKGKEIRMDGKTVSNLYDLWQLLGQEKTVSHQNVNHTNFSYTDSSWYALADIVTRVGFRIKPEHFHDGTVDTYVKLSTNKKEDISNQQKDIYDSQLNVIQPLKFAFVSNITPESCIKFGGISGTDINHFRSAIIPQKNSYLMTISNIHAGIQQDSEHEVDVTTEVTQMVNGMALDNMTPELLTLYKDIQEHVVASMDKYYQSYNFINLNDNVNRQEFLEHVNQLVFIYKKLKNQVLNSAYNLGQTQIAIMATNNDFVDKYDAYTNGRTPKQEDYESIKDIFENSYKISLGDQNVYNMFVTTLASINSKIAIRRKSQGAATILVPHEGFMSFLEIPTYNNDRFDYENYMTITPDQFDDLIKRRPEYKQLLQSRYKTIYKNSESGQILNDFELSLFTHYRINGTETIYIHNYTDLDNLKEKFYQTDEIQSIEVDLLSGYIEDLDERQNSNLTIGRPLKPIDVKIKSTNGRIYNIYDFEPTKLLFMLNENKANIDVVKTIIKERLQKLSEIAQTYNESTDESIKSELELALRKRNMPAVSMEDIDELSPKQLVNYLRYWLNLEFQKVHKGLRNFTDEDILLKNKIPTFDESQEFTIQNIPQEKIMQYYDSAKFNIRNWMTLQDISEESILKELNQQVNEVDTVNLQLKGRKKQFINPDMYIMSDMGNVYLFSSKNVRIDNYLPVPENLIKTYSNNIKYVEITPGKPLIEYNDDIKDRLYITTSGDEVKLLFDTNVDNVDTPNVSQNDLERQEIALKMLMDQRTEKIALQVRYINSASDSNESQKLVINKQADKFTEHLSQYFDMLFREDLLSDESQQQNTLRGQAKQKFSSFLMSLKHASSRIPGQSYQSFSNTRTTNFLHGEQNSILVSAYNIWLTGGDFDIDKLYNMGYYLNPRGILIGWNSFFNHSSIEHLEQSMDLPSKGTINLTQQGVDYESVKDIINNVIHTTRKKQNIIAKKLTNVNIENFKNFVQVYNEIMDKGLYVAKMTPEINAIIKLLSQENFNLREIEKQLENKIVHAERKNLQDVRNIVSSFSPISIAQPTQLKENPLNPNYKKSKLNHLFNPIAQPEAIFNQYAGKNVVGINAAGLKLYQTVSYVVEKELNDQKSASVEKLKQMLFTTIIKTDDKGTISVKNGFQGINYELTPESLERLERQLSEMNAQDQETVKKMIQEELKLNYKSDSVQLQISQLLSAATDNGKELILGIINQGAETQGVYIYQLTLGFPLEAIGKILVSEPVNFILNNSKGSILLNQRNIPISGIISWFFRIPKFNSFILPGTTLQVYKALGTSKKEFMQLSTEDAENLIEKKKTELLTISAEPGGFEEDDMYDDYFDLEDFYSPPKTYDAYSRLLRYIEIRKKIDAFTSSAEHMDTVRWFARLMQGSSILQGTTQILASNQGIKPTDMEIMNMLINFEDMIINMAGPNTNFNSNDVTLTEEELSLIKSFNINKFFNDENYQDVMIRTVDKIKYDLNPLATIYYSEHFREMIRATINTSALLEKHSIVYRTIKRVINSDVIDGLNENNKFILEKYNDMNSMRIEPVTVLNRKLSKPAYDSLQSIIQDQNIHTSLISLQKELNSTKRAPIIENEDGSLAMINLSSLEDRRKFVTFVENRLIPRLKQGMLIAGQSKPNMRVQKNEFVRKLTLTDFRIRNSKGEFFTAYGIQIPKLTDGLQEKVKVNRLQNALYDLQNFRYKYMQPDGTNKEGLRIIDMLFLYNLIVHRNKDGDATLTSYFSIDRVPDSLMNVYMRHSDKVNNSLETLDINRIDLQANGFHSGLDPKINLASKLNAYFNYKYIDIIGSSESNLLWSKTYSNLKERLESLAQNLGDRNIEITIECD